MKAKFILSKILYYRFSVNSSQKILEITKSQTGTLGQQTPKTKLQLKIEVFKILKVHNIAVSIEDVHCPDMSLSKLSHAL
jgi:hypothetical protein